ncbi:MAG TPA: RDD family protein, partial [Lacunisphaera sp.]|nr:RDD family protein [Lacunisphaera sp.]
DVPPQMAAPVESAGIVPPLVSAAPVVISAATLFRAGFWIRVAAALLDTVLVGIVFGMLNSMFGAFVKFGGSFPLWFVVYNIVMWGTKGTTIGGIICGLKVVRLDDRPLDWSVAIVRALGAFLSLAVAGLGFIWVAFDDERQSWHDKIAGTTIVKVPKGTPLL